MQTLYHIAQKDDWKNAQNAGTYTISTLNKTLNEVGFIHLSFVYQVKMVADFLYKEIDDLVLLKIDPEKLTSDVRVEAVNGTDEKFPHLYGPLNIDAVLQINDYALDDTGSFPKVQES